MVAMTTAKSCHGENVMVFHHVLNTKVCPGMTLNFPHRVIYIPHPDFNDLSC